MTETATQLKKRLTKRKKRKKGNIVTKIVRAFKKKDRATLIRERQQYAKDVSQAIQIMYQKIDKIPTVKEMSDEIDALRREGAEQQVAVAGMGRRIAEFYMQRELETLTKIFDGKWIYNPALGKTKRFIDINLEEIL